MKQNNNKDVIKNKMKRIKELKKVKNEGIWISIGIGIVAVICLVTILLIVLNNQNIDYSYKEDFDTTTITIELDNVRGTDEALDELKAIVDEDVSKDSKITAQKKISSAIVYLCEYDEEQNNTLADANDNNEQALYYSYYLIEYISTNEENYTESDEINSIYELGYNAYTYIKFVYRSEESSTLYKNLFSQSVITIKGN